MHPVHLPERKAQLIVEGFDGGRACGHEVSGAFNRFTKNKNVVGVRGSPREARPQQR